MARFSFRREPDAEAPPRLVVTDPKDEAPTQPLTPAAPAKEPKAASKKAEPAPQPPAVKLNLMLDDEPDDIGPVASDSMLDMRLRLHSKLIEEIDLSKLEKLDEGEMRRQVRRLVADFAKTERLALNSGELDELGASVFDEMVGLGPIEPLLKDDSIADILINGPFQIYVERRGELEVAPVRFRDNEHLLRIVNRIVAGVGRRVDESSPLVDARLPDGSRVNAAIGPVAIDGAAVSIRKFSKKPYNLERLVGVGAMPAPVAEFLYGAIRSRVSTVISGGTGSGKTTLLNALSAAIRNKERLITIEDAAELQLQQPHVVRMETRPPNIEGKGEIRQRELVKNALRMRPDRVILGEVRGEEAFDMLQAMNTGHEGSMATIHANTPRDAVTRLEQMVAMSGMRLLAGIHPRPDRLGGRDDRPGDASLGRQAAPDQRHRDHRDGRPGGADAGDLRLPPHLDRR